MDRSELSRMYAVATSRCNESLTEFYEQIHDMFGDPVNEMEHIDDSIKTIKKIIATELDLVKQACIQYNEIRQEHKGGGQEAEG